MIYSELYVKTVRIYSPAREHQASQNGYERAATFLNLAPAVGSGPFLHRFSSPKS